MEYFGCLVFHTIRRKYRGCKPERWTVLARNTDEAQKLWDCNISAQKKVLRTAGSKAEEGLPSVGNNIRLLQYILQYYCNISYCNIIAIQYIAIRISCNIILELSIPIYIADYCNIGIAFFAILEHVNFSFQGQFCAHLTSTSTFLLQIE